MNDAENNTNIEKPLTEQVVSKLLTDSVHSTA